MSNLEIISQTHTGVAREVDGQLQHPLTISNIALTTPISHDYYPIPLFSLSGEVGRVQPTLHATILARTQYAEEIIAFVRTNHPNILALSAPQGTLRILQETLKKLQEFGPENRPQIILGGSLPTYLPNIFFNEFPDLPLTIIGGWGEVAFANEVKEYSIMNPIPEQKFVIGAYPEHYPRQDGVPKKGEVPFNYARAEATRGCFWGACSYCLRPLNEQQGKWKQYDLADVTAQVGELLRLGYDGYLDFADEEPIGTNIGLFANILDELINLRKKYSKFTFGINMRADHVISSNSERQRQYDEFLQKAKRAGLANVWMGAESYSCSHLEILHKGQHITPLTNLAAAKKIDSYGIKVTQGFIPYHPLSNWQELLEMANFMEPHALFLSKILGAPFGYMRVQYNTPYEHAIRRLEDSTNYKLLGELDENMLTYECKYRDPSIGLHAGYMRIFYDWINPYLKQMHVEALKGNRDSQDNLNKLRAIVLQLFLESIKQLEPLKDSLVELKKQQLLILEKYKIEIGNGNFGINTVKFDELIQHHSADYLDKFM